MIYSLFSGHFAHLNKVKCSTIKLTINSHTQGRTGATAQLQQTSGRTKNRSTATNSGRTAIASSTATNTGISKSQAQLQQTQAELAT